MPKKKKSEKKTRKKRKAKKIIRAPRESSQIERTLIENFVSLQKVMANLSSRFDSLSDQISKLLGLFEISAKVLAEKDFELEGRNSKENEKILEKIDKIIEQNKTIARGLTLVHEQTSPQIPSYSSTQTNYPPVQPSYSPKPAYPPTQSIDSVVPKPQIQKLPGKPVPRVTMSQGDDGEYHKSITSSQSRLNEQ
ncbi:MAG TPA: hypothetical protein PK357_01675 [Candidatus Pacearchaeota archaeon]|nr:hypothetical protein [Candidatus Pacearchaeota archaeon]